MLIFQLASGFYLQGGDVGAFTKSIRRLARLGAPAPTTGIGIVFHRKRGSAVGTHVAACRRDVQRTQVVDMVVRGRADYHLRTSNCLFRSLAWARRLGLSPS